MHMQLGWSRTGLLVGALEVKRVARLTFTVFIANIHLLAGFRLARRECCSYFRQLVLDVFQGLFNFVDLLIGHSLSSSF